MHNDKDKDTCVYSQKECVCVYVYVCVPHLWMQTKPPFSSPSLSRFLSLSLIQLAHGIFKVQMASVFSGRVPIQTTESISSLSTMQTKENAVRRQYVLNYSLLLYLLIGYYFLEKPCARCDQHENECVYDEQTTRRAPASRKVKHEDDVSNSDSSGGSGGYRGVSKHPINNHADSRQPYHHPASPIPSSSSSPISKKQYMEEQYIRKHLKRISFTNAMYEPIRQQRCTNATTRSYLFATSLPPLMLDFFNLTSLPCQIWTSFTRRFREWMRLNTIETSDAVTHEALELFSKHNLLYGSLFDSGQLNHSLTSGFLMQVQAIQDDDSPTTMVLCAILALVFYAAFQSLTTSCQDIAQRLEDCANLCFQEAQQRFLRDTFMAPSRELDQDWLLQLTRVSVLLTHYACTAIDEETAYMTLRLGIGYAARCSLISSNDNMTNGAELDPIEYTRVRRLLRVLDAWQTWLSFYLHRDDWIIESLPGMRNNGTPSEDKADCHPGSQSWAIHAIQAYTDFLKRVSSTDMTLQGIKVYS